MSDAQVAPAETLHVPARALVVVAGVPGAGKTTLLRRWMATGVPGTTVLDSEQVRSRAPGWVPYTLLRPVVHLVHWIRIGLAVGSRTGLVVAHAPATSAAHRALLTRWARLAGRPTVLVAIDVTAVEAWRGQLSRGRIIRSVTMARHADRWSVLRRVARAGQVPGFDVVRVVSRAEADDLQAVRADGESLSL